MAEHGWGFQGGVYVLDPATGKPALPQTIVVEGGIDTTGLATEAKQDTGISSLNDIYEALAAGIDVTVTNQGGGGELAEGAATSANQQTIKNSVDNVVARLNSALVAEVTGSVSSSITQSVLPTGAATSAKQDSIVSAIAALQTSQGGTKDVNVTNASIPVTDNGGSLTIDATSLPLPTGAATAANQATEITALGAIRDAVQATQNVSVTSTVTTPVTDNGGSLTVDGTVGISGPVEVSNQPTGYSTSALQTSGNASLASIDANTPALENGRVPVATRAASIPAVTGTITANGQTISADVSQASNLVAYVTGTFSTVNVAFEASIDGTSWFQIQGVRSNANTIESATGNLSAAPTYAWEFSVNAYSNFRIRATAFTSGTQNWRFLLGTYATEPVPAVPTHPVTVASGTITSNPPTGTPYTLTTAASTNASLVVNNARNLFTLSIANTSASAIYVKLYNLAAAPTVGTSVPIMTIPVPSNQFYTAAFGQLGQRFAAGISLAVTAGIATTDTAAVSAGSLIALNYA